MEVIHAAAHLEKIQGIVGELFCRRARRKRSVVDRAPTQATELSGRASAAAIAASVDGAVDKIGGDKFEL